MGTLAVLDVGCRRPRRRRAPDPVPGIGCERRAGRARRPRARSRRSTSGRAGCRAVSISSTSSPSGSTSASGVPAARASSSSMIPPWSCADLELALGEDHPVGDLAAELALLDREVAAGMTRAGQHDRDRRAGAEVPGAADDLRAARPPPRRPSSAAACRRSDASPASSTLPDDEVLEVAVGPRHAAADDAVDLTAREDEPARELLERQVDLDVLAEPVDGTFIRTGSGLGGRSPRTRAGRAGRARSIAIRSIPKPNAKPDHSSGSRLDVAEHVGVDPAGAAHLDPARVLARRAARAAADEAGRCRTRPTAR